MGWLEGLLSGYADTQGDIRRENARLAEQSAAREASVMKDLLNSPDPQTRTLAATGLLANTQPQKRKSGFSGWMGEMESNPIYPTLLKHITTPQQIGEDVKTTTTTPEQAGYKPTLATPPSPTKPAAQTSVQTTTPGAPPPQAQQPLPQPTPPPAPPSLAMTPEEQALNFNPPSPPQALTPEEQAINFSNLTPPPAPPTAAAVPTAAAPGAVAAAPAAAPAALPPTSPTVGAPPPTVPQVGMDQLPGALPQTKPESLTQTTRTPIMALPHAFPTVEDTEIAAARAKGIGEFQYLTEVGRRAGQPNPEKWAADMIAAEHARRAAGASPYRLEQVAWTDANGQQQSGWGSYNQATGGLILGDGTPLPPNAHILGKPGTAPTRALTKYEEVAARLFGTGAPEEDPHQVVMHLTPLQRGQVEQEIALRDAQEKVQQANAMAGAPMLPAAKAHLEEQLATKWQTVQKPLAEMRDGVQDMQAALSRFNADPNGASQAIVTKFEKILNPTSMVRQQAYERTPTYLGLDQKIQGLWERYAGRVNPDTGQWISGGPGIPYTELQELAETARQFLVIQAQNNDGERQRIEAQIRDNRLNPQTVFGNTVVVPPQFGTQPPPKQPAVTQPAATQPAATTNAPAAATRGVNSRGQVTITIP